MKFIHKTSIPEGFFTYLKEYPFTDSIYPSMYHLTVCQRVYCIPNIWKT